MRYDTIDLIYVVSVSLAFALLFFANETHTPDGIITSLGIGKLFYAPCLLSLILSIFKRHRIDRIDKIIILLLVLSILSSIVNPPKSGDFLTWSLTRFCLGIFCFWNIRNVDSLLFIRVLALLSPIVIILHYHLTDPFSYGLYRYSGFYGDPNYLAMGLNFIISINYLNWKSAQWTVFKIISIATIALTIPLVMVSLSRGGIIGLCIIVMYIIVDLFRDHKRVFLLLSVLILLSGSSLLLVFTSQIDNIETRFSLDSESDVRSANSRVLEIQSVYGVFASHPILIPFGVGLGNNMYAADLYHEDYVDPYQVHNTFFKLLFEQGVFAFLVFTYLMIWQLITLCKNKRKDYLALYLASLIPTMTLGCITFMPFWIIFFFLWNRKLW